MQDKQPGAATLLDVANEAGVSLATASRAFNGSTRKVREDLRARVLAAAEKLNYTANAQAQAMARGHTNVVGLVVADIADPFFSSIAAGVAAAAEEQGLLVTLGSTTRSPRREVDYLAALRGQRSRAVIIAGSRIDDAAVIDALTREIVAFEKAGGKVVAISQAKLPVDTVVVENRAGARALATALAEIGYRRFAILSGPADLLTSRDRVLGFNDGLAKAGLARADVIGGEFTRDGGYASMADLLARGERPECVFAVNDVMAMGAGAAARAAGLRVPDDLALAGFDDIGPLRDLDPPVTTVQVPLGDIGRMALDLVVTSSDTPRQRRVRGTVMLRESTPPRR